MKTIKLLTIGNSFSGNAVKFLESIALGTDSVRFDIARADLGGCSLEKHWNLSRYTDRHPEFKTYQLYPDVRGSLQEALALGPWDFVTLQQVSAISWVRESFEPFLGNLHALVSELAPRAEIRLHQTWAYRSDSPFLPENGLTQECMFEKIRDVYAHYAKAYGCGVLPSGEAVQAARREPGRQFVWPEPDFAYRNAEPPALPRQENSLAVGWQWNMTGTPNGVPSLGLDANHLNDRGCYLVGALWFESLSGEDSDASSFVPEGMDPEDARFLRSVAKRCRAR